MKARSFSHNIALSFVPCISDNELLQRNLLASQCLDLRFQHEVVAVRNCPSAAAGLIVALDRALREFVVCVHQGVFLPAGWDPCLTQQLRKAERQFGPIGFAGVDGLARRSRPDDPGQPLGAERIGWVNDRGRVLRRWARAPRTRGDARRDRAGRAARFGPQVRSGAWFSSLWGRYLPPSAANKGWRAAALAAPCHHHSRSVGLPEGFLASARGFRPQMEQPVAGGDAVRDH